MVSKQASDGILDAMAAEIAAAVAAIAAAILLK